MSRNKLGWLIIVTGILFLITIFISSYSVNAQIKLDDPGKQVKGILEIINGGTGVSSSLVFDVTNPAYGAVCDGTTDDLTKFELARNAANTVLGGCILIPGDCAISGNFNIATDNPICIIGLGPEISIIRQLANGGVDTLSINQASSNTVGFQVKNLTINNSAAATNTGINLNVGLSYFDNVKYIGGAVGLNVNLGAGNSYFSKQFFADQTTDALLINGDSSGEIYFIDSRITRETSGTLVDGVHRTKTNSSDIGGVYFSNFRITRGSGTITNCYNFQDDVTPGPLFLTMVNSVADGCTVPLNIEGNNFTVSNSWFIPVTNVGTDSIVIDRSKDGSIVGNQLINCASGISFLNSANNIDSIGNNIDCVTNMYRMPGSSPPTEITYRDSNPKDIGISNLIETWQDSSDYWVTTGFRIYTDGSGGSNQTLSIYNSLGTLKQNLRIDSLGNLEIVNNAFTQVLIEILDGGGFQIKDPGAKPTCVTALHGTFFNDTTSIEYCNDDGTPDWENVIAGAAGGETNTGSNQGAGIGFFDGKAGVDLEHRSGVSANNRLTIALDGPNKEIDFTIVEANFDLANLGGTLGTGQAASAFLLNIEIDTFAELDTIVADESLVNAANNLSVFAATTSVQLSGVLSDETGTGLFVLQTSPTILTPTIASFINSIHDHSNAAGGGTFPIGNTTEDLAASRVDDGGAASTQALFSGAGGSASFRAIVDADIPNTITIDTATALAANPSSTTGNYCADRNTNGSCATQEDLDDLNGTVAIAQLEDDAKRFYDCETIFDTAADIPDTADIPSLWGEFVQEVLITKVWCEVEANTTTINLQRDDGSPVDILSSDLVCDTTEQDSCASGCDVNTIAAAEDNVLAGQQIDFVIVSTGSVRRINICVSGIYQ